LLNGLLAPKLFFLSLPSPKCLLPPSNAVFRNEPFRFLPFTGFSANGSAPSPFGGEVGDVVGGSSSMLFLLLLLIGLFGGSGSLSLEEGLSREEGRLPSPLLLPTLRKKFSFCNMLPDILRLWPEAVDFWDAGDVAVAGDEGAETEGVSHEGGNFMSSTDEVSLSLSACSIASCRKTPETVLRR